jgi:hypothetical protein
MSQKKSPWCVVRCILLLLKKKKKIREAVINKSTMANAK